MAFPTAVNDHITDAVTQTNVKVIGEAPAMAMGTIYQSMAHATQGLHREACGLTRPMTRTTSPGAGRSFVS